MLRQSLKTGKVRCLRFDRSHLMTNQILMETSDRLSANDQSLGEITGKGQMLSQIGQWWFERCPVKNHFQYASSPTSWVCAEANPIPLEFIVRRYLYGSMWRNYEKGQRTFWGLELEDDIHQGQELPELLVTPTTKETEAGKHDRPITKSEIIEQAILTEEQYNTCEKLAKTLFTWGAAVCQTNGIVLVDTKYEFGFDCENGQILLIDEIHTPDSSRFWKHPFTEPLMSDTGPVVETYDKDIARAYLRNNPETEELPDALKDQLMYGYTQVYQHLLRKRFKDLSKLPVVTVMAGSLKDSKHCQEIIREIERNGMSWRLYYGSAHRNTKNVLEYLNSVENSPIITVAGKSNALSAIVACNCNNPVIACPPFTDKTDMLVNIHSTLQMPTGVPVMTVLNPSNAVLASKRMINIFCNFANS